MNTSLPTLQPSNLNTTGLNNRGLIGSRIDQFMVLSKKHLHIDKKNCLNIAIKDTWLYSSSGKFRPINLKNLKDKLKSNFPILISFIVPYDFHYMSPQYLRCHSDTKSNYRITNKIPICIKTN